MTTTGNDRPHRGDDAGFSLIEILVSLGIIGMVMASLGFFLIRSMSITTTQGDRQTAARLAADGMERVREAPAPTAAQTVSTLNRSDTTIDGVTYTRVWSSAPGGTGLLRVTVTVTWPGVCGGAPCSYSAQTLISTAASEPLFNTELP